MGQFVDGVLDPADVLELASRMAVHQLQAVEHVAFLEQRMEVQDLADEQPELGFLSRRFAPAPGALARELHPYADLRPHPVALGVLQNQMNLFVILDHRDDGAAELGGQDHRFDVGVVFEAVAHDDAVGRVFGDGHDGEQFRLGADFQAEAELLAVAVHLFDHQALLIDLDRENRRVAVLVVVLGDGGGEGLGEVAQAVRENIGEADDHRRVQVAGLQALHDVVQVDFARGVLIRADHHMALGIDRKVTFAPGFHLVQIQRLLDLPCGVHGQRLGGCVHVARTITNWGCM